MDRSKEERGDQCEESSLKGHGNETNFSNFFLNKSVLPKMPRMLMWQRNFKAKILCVTEPVQKKA